MTRRQVFRELALHALRDSSSQALQLRAIYDNVSELRPDLTDDEVESDSGRLKWKHELRWEIESLVRSGLILRRKELGRGWYSNA